MKKLLLVLIIASTLPIVGMDTSDDPEKGSKKRPASEIGEGETSAAKRAKTREDDEDEVLLGQAGSNRPSYTFDHPDVFCNYGLTHQQHEKEILKLQHKKARAELFQAIKKGDADGAKKILALSNLDIKTPYKKKGEPITALQYAISRKPISLPIVQMLLDHGADPNICTQDHTMPLIDVLDNPNDIEDETQLQCVEMLLMAKANPNFSNGISSLDTDSEADNPLTRIMGNVDIRKNTLPLCTMLLRYGADVNGASDIDGEGLSVDISEPTRITPLLALCYYWSDKIEFHYSENDVSNLITRLQPLSLAKLFLTAGADITIKDCEGDTPLNALSPDSQLAHQCDIACEVNHTRQIRALNKTLLEAIQEQIREQTSFLQKTLETCHRGNWQALTSIIASYLYTNPTPKEAAPSSSSAARSKDE